MAAWRRAIELSLTDTDTAKLTSIAQSRTEPASRVERARILLAYREDPSFYAVGQVLGLHHQTVQRCVERAWRKGIWQRLMIVRGPAANLPSRSKPRRSSSIWPVAKPRTLAIRTNCGRRGCSPPCPRTWTSPRTYVPRQPRPGHFVQDPRPGRSQAAQNALLLRAPRPRVRRKNGRGIVRLPPSENLEEEGVSKSRQSEAVAIVSYDEKPGIQAIATTAPDLPPKSGRAREFRPRARI